MTDIVESPPVEQLKVSLRKLLGAVVDKSIDAAAQGVEKLSDMLEDVARSGGPLTGAAGGGVRAALAGRNPLWGAVKGMVANLSTGTKVLIVLAAVLSLLLGPVVLVVALVALLALAIVAAVRSTPTQP
jgi:hypothetical protein